MNTFKIVMLLSIAGTNLQLMAPPKKNPQQEAAEKRREEQAAKTAKKQAKRYAQSFEKCNKLIADIRRNDDNTIRQLEASIKKIEQEKDDMLRQRHSSLESALEAHRSGNSSNENPEEIANEIKQMEAIQEYFKQLDKHRKS